MSKLVAFLCLVCLLLTALWVGLLVADMASAGPLETFEQVAAHASRLHGLFYAAYINAALLTLAAGACILGVIGFLVGSAPLAEGVMIGGILFLAAMFPLAWGFWKTDNP
jgi:hypothetical protein